jgi:hypothetical protein
VTARAGHATAEPMSGSSALVARQSLRGEMVVTLDGGMTSAYPATIWLPIFAHGAALVDYDHQGVRIIPVIGRYCLARPA